MSATATQPVDIGKVERKLKAFALGGPDLLSPASSSLLAGTETEEDSSEEEAVMRRVFADTMAEELAYLRQQRVEVCRDRSRQILADVLVWAEITQKHYDPNTQRFVVEPNKNDEAFQRVGRFFLAAKQRYGLA